MVSKCCMCKKKAWCFDDDGKTPYCQDCWDKTHKDLSLAEASKPFMDGVQIERKRVLELIKELLPKYYEDGADEFAGQLIFALEKEDEKEKNDE